MKTPELTLAAEDAEDLEIISARLQDAVAPLKELVWLPRKRRFAALLNRFKWEEKHRGADLRVRSLLHFDGVLSVKSKGLKHGAPDAVVSLLAIRFTPKGGESTRALLSPTRVERAPLRFRGRNHGHTRIMVRPHAAGL